MPSLPQGGERVEDSLDLRGIGLRPLLRHTMEAAMAKDLEVYKYENVMIVVYEDDSKYGGATVCSIHDRY